MGISSALGSSALLPAGLGFRNVIINGGFDIWQRGTSAAFTSTAATSFLADRWSGYRGAAGSTQSRVSAGLDGFQYAMRVQRDSGNTSVFRPYIGTSLETSTATKLANKQVVLSFYARAGANYSSASNGLNVLLSSGTGTETNGMYVGFTSATNVINTTATLTTSWQCFTYYGVMPATSSQLFVQFDFTPVGTAGVSDYFEITGVQLEQNYQPTPFEQRPYGIELALCQRYYWRTSTTTSGILTSFSNPAYTVNSADFFIPHPVTMRAKPTSFESSNVVMSDDIGANITGITPRAINSNGTTLDYTFVTFDKTSGFTTRYYYALVVSGTGYIAASAEL